MENNEMINNVAEEVVTEAVENTVSDPSFAQKYPALYAAGAGALITGAIIVTAHTAEAACEACGRFWNKLRDKRNARKAEKAKKVEGTDTTVKEEA